MQHDLTALRGRLRSVFSSNGLALLDWTDHPGSTIRHVAVGRPLTAVRPANR